MKELVVAVAMLGCSVLSVQAKTVSVWLNDSVDGGSWNRYLDDPVGAIDFKTNENKPFRPAAAGDAPFNYSGNSSMEFDGAAGSAWVDGGIEGTALELRSMLTVECWIKPTDLSSDGGKEWQYIVGSGVNYGLVFNDKDQELVFAYYQAGGTRFAEFSVSPAVLGDGDWHHIAATLNTDSREIKLYVDGVLDATHKTRGESPLNYEVYGFYMGGDGSAPQQGRNFSGLIDEVRISDAVLDTADLGFHETLKKKPSPVEAPMRVGMICGFPAGDILAAVSKKKF